MCLPLEYYWAEELLVANGDPKLQAVMLDKLIHVVAQCKALNNFFSMFTILGALDTPRTRKLAEVNQCCGESTHCGRRVAFPCIDSCCLLSF